MSDRDDAKLPAVAASRLNRMQNEVEDPRPGTWWRLSRPADPQEDSHPHVRSLIAATQKHYDRIAAYPWAKEVTAPEHGIILLLKDARYVDGVLHSLELAGHPAWRHSDQTTKLLTEEFLFMMIEAPDGAALREAEEARLRDHIGVLTQNLSTPPSDAEVMRLVDEKVATRRAETESKRQQISGPDDAQTDDLDRMSRLVPAALLPSRDIAQAEEVIQRQIMVAEATGQVLKARIERVNRGMEVVGRYQEEKVATSLATISRQMDYAGKMMAKVHSMKLWLGDGVGLSRISEGRGAAEGEPIRFMQQLLYLDEEIYTHSMVNVGFSSDNFREMPALLRDNPDVVSRIVPFDRCVAITRVRREARDFPVPGTWGDIFRDISRAQRDERIMIFARDGENLTIITADEDTSKAQRLFPSAAEINNLFRDRGLFGAGRIIDVDDVSYAERRANHDAVALHYKRFLLILWGAHEREGLFGNLPAGLNWLTNETHNDHFRFIHDEEMGLSVERQPVLSWIRDHNHGLRAGSRAVMNWKDIFSEHRSPGAYSHPEHKMPELIREPYRQHGIVDVVRKGEQLFAACPTIQIHSSWREDRKVSNVNVLLQGHVSEPSTIEQDGLFCIDHMTSADLLGYIESRKERRSYIQWLHEFRMALPEIVAREKAETELVARISGANPDLPGKVISVLPAIAHEAVLASGWALPDEGQDTKILKQAQVVAAGLQPADGDMRLIVRPGGVVCRFREAPSLLGSELSEPFWIQENCDLRSDGELRVRSEKVVPAFQPEGPGEIRIWSAEAPQEEKNSRRRRRLSLPDRSWVQDVLSPEWAEARLQWMDSVLAPSEEDARSWVKALLEHNEAHSKGTVLRPNAETVLGLVVLQPDGFSYSGREKNPELRALVMSVDQLAHARLAGYAGLTDHFSIVYKDPSAFFRTMENMKGRPTVSFRVVTPNEGQDFRTTDTGGRWDSNYCEIGFRDLKQEFFTMSGDKRHFSHAFGERDLRTGILRGLMQESPSQYERLSPDDRKAWISKQMDMVVKIDPRIEERIFRLIGMFEPLPSLDEENENRPGI